MILTDAQYLAAARAALGVKPEHTHISDKFVLAAIQEICLPEYFRAALAVAYEAGRASVGGQVGEEVDRIRSVEHYDDDSSESHSFSGPGDLVAFATASAERSLADKEAGCVRVEILRFTERTYWSDVTTVARLGDWPATGEDHA